MGFIRSGNTNLTLSSSDKELTDYLWPIIREIVKTVIENHQNLIVEGCYIPIDWAKDFERAYLDYIRYKCLIMSDQYIRGHFAEIKGYANIIEERLDDSYCTMESVLQDNAAMLELAQNYGVDYLLINDEYDVGPIL